MGSKVVFVQRKDMNKITHSYTAQDSITLSGRVLPQVFVCSQEQTGTFRSRVQKQVDEYMKKYKNVVTSSKSRELSTSSYEGGLKSFRPQHEDGSTRQ